MLKMNAKNSKQIPVSCNRDCGAGCPLIAHILDGKVIRITDNPLKDDDMGGCVRGYRMTDTLYSEKRLKRPLLQTGKRGSDTFKEISWNEALNRIARELAKIRDSGDCTAVFAFDGSGSCRGALHNSVHLTKRFFSIFGGYTGRTDTYSSAAAAFIEKFLFGTRAVGFDAPTLQHSKLIILWGANLSETRFGCRIESWIGTLNKSGVPVIVIDPRRSLTAKTLASQWIPIRPGTDTAMMAAVLYVLISEGYVDRPFTDRYTVGFDDLVDMIMGNTDGVIKDPHWAERRCDVPAGTIADFARTYGKTKPAALLPGLSLQRTLGGEETYRFTTALQAATGNIGRLGGSSGGEYWGSLPVPFFPQMPVPFTPNCAAMPIYRWSDAVIQGKAGGYPSDIKLIYNVGTNLVNQGSDIKKNIRAFEKVDFAVTHDYFMTPTARYSDIVLPVTTFLERADVVFPKDNFLFYSAKATDPLHESRNDYDVLWDLADRLGFGEKFSENRSAEQWLEAFLAESKIQNINHFKSTGILKGEQQMRVGLAAFVEDTEKNPLATPSGKIEIRSEAFAETGFSAIPECRIAQPDSTYPLRLITPHSRFRVNSQNSNLPWVEAFEIDFLEMNCSDGEARSIQQGDRVRILSPEGEMEVAVKLTEEIVRGTVCLYQGAWSSRDSNGIERGGAANSLTSTNPTMPSGGSRTHTVFVQVFTTRSCP